MSLPKRLVIFVLCLTLGAPFVSAQQSVKQPKKTEPKTAPKTAPMTAEEAESLGAQALQFLADEPRLLARFLAFSGIAPQQVRRAAAEPGFLAGVLDFLLAHEPDLMAFSAASGRPPVEIVRARAALGPGGGGEE